MYTLTPHLRLYHLIYPLIGVIVIAGNLIAKIRHKDNGLYSETVSSISNSVPLWLVLVRLRYFDNMRCFHLLAAVLFCIYQYKIVCEDITIYRSSCRRDALFKKTDANKKVTGSITTIKRIVVSLAVCVRDCLKMISCLSVNFMKAPGNESSCELLDVRKSNATAVLSAAPGWNHYEPIVQV